MQFLKDDVVILGHIDGHIEALNDTGKYWTHELKVSVCLLSLRNDAFSVKELVVDIFDEYVEGDEIGEFRLVSPFQDSELEAVIGEFIIAGIEFNRIEKSDISDGCSLVVFRLSLRQYSTTAINEVSV